METITYECKQKLAVNLLMNKIIIIVVYFIFVLIFSFPFLQCQYYKKLSEKKFTMYTKTFLFHRKMKIIHINIKNIIGMILIVKKIFFVKFILYTYIF